MWGIQELTFTTEQNTALCMCELRYRKPERRGKQQGQVPLLEYKRDEEFPLEKTPAPLTDYNRRLKPLSHRHGPNSPSLASRSEVPFRSPSAVGSRDLVRGLNPRVTIIFAFSLYSWQFHDFPFVDELLSSRSNTCRFLGTSGSWLARRVARSSRLLFSSRVPIVALCFSRSKISNKSINTIIW